MDKNAVKYAVAALFVFVLLYVLYKWSQNMSDGRLERAPEPRHMPDVTQGRGDDAGSIISAIGTGLAALTAAAGNIAAEQRRNDRADRESEARIRREDRAAEREDAEDSRRR